MIRRSALGLSLCLALVGCSSATGSPSPSRTPGISIASPAISTEWTEYHRDASRSGLGADEPALNGAHVAWSMALDGDVYASPLIVAGHVIVATENNTVYSMDLFTGSTVWSTHLGDPVDARTLPCGNIRPVSGITGTPAADIKAGMAYVVAYLRGHHHMLFALSLVDGSVAWQQDVDPSGSNPTAQQFRGALAVGSGFVYVPVGGLFGDCADYHGYVVAVPQTGGQGRAFKVSDQKGAGVWSPMGVSIASDGSVYAVTGNAFGSGYGYSDSVLQLSADLLTVKSYFAPSNWAELNASDVDLGSVGATLMARNYVVAIGKEGVAYLLRGGALGGIGGQVASRHVCAGAWGGTAWFEDTVLVPCRDGLYALEIGNTSIEVRFRFPQASLGSPIISADAIWAIDANSATLYAIDPRNAQVLFSLSLGGAMPFSTPAATDGFVVAPAGQKVVALAVVGG